MDKTMHVILYLATSIILMYLLIINLYCGKKSKVSKKDKLCYEPDKETTELIEKSRKKRRNKLYFPRTGVTTKELAEALFKLGKLKLIDHSKREK